MRAAARVRALLPPPMDVMNARAAALRAGGADVISLGQAVPGFAPPPAALEAARAALAEPATHTYSADAGLRPAREGVAAYLAAHGGPRLDPARELILTPGGNHAFQLAVLTLLEPGDRVLLPAPYYFNHAMAVALAGGAPVEVPLPEEAGFPLRWQDVAPFLDGARVLVVVTPANPTGAVADPDELARVARAAAERGVTLITDETYQHYLYDGARHVSAAALPGLAGRVITTASFGKTFCMPGWRLGYLAGPADFVAEALKVQDTVAICATVAAQKALLGALREPQEELARRVEVLDERRRALAERLARVPRLRWVPTRGALFAFVRVEGCADSYALAADVLEKAHVVTSPGRAFGACGEDFLRLSYGAVERPRLEEACDRLARYFAERD